MRHAGVVHGRAGRNRSGCALVKPTLYPNSSLRSAPASAFRHRISLSDLQNRSHGPVFQGAGRIRPEAGRGSRRTLEGIARDSSPTTRFRRAMRPPVCTGGDTDATGRCSTTVSSWGLSFQRGSFPKQRTIRVRNALQRISQTCCAIRTCCAATTPWRSSPWTSSPSTVSRSAWFNASPISWASETPTGICVWEAAAGPISPISSGKPKPTARPRLRSDTTGSEKK